MKLIALDTSSDACSVALLADGSVFARHETLAREHTRLVVPMLEEVRAEAGIAYADLDAVVLGNGPGSFIGMRIAASVAQGLAFGAGLPVVPVSSMAAVALDVFDSEDVEFAAVAQDAHMQEAYFGLYRRGEGGLADPASEERLARQETLDEISDLDPERCVGAGLGWHLYPELARANEQHLRVADAYRYPDARNLLRLGERAFAAGETVRPENVDPAYLRQKVASVPGRKSP